MIGPKKDKDEPLRYSDLPQCKASVYAGPSRCSYDSCGAGTLLAMVAIVLFFNVARMIVESRNTILERLDALERRLPPPLPSTSAPAPTNTNASSIAVEDSR